MSAAPPLHELQRWMQAKILARPAAERSAALNAQRGTPGVERLSVYADGYLARVHDALGEVYEGVRHILGEARFDRMAVDYARRFPSRDYNLSFVGRHLPAFLVTAPVSQQLPFLPDLAALEWAVCQAFHAFDTPPVDLSRYAELSMEQWASARLTLQPSVQLVASMWPILDLWQTRDRPREEIDVDLRDRPQRVMVCRLQSTVRCEQLTEAHYRMMEGLLAGQPLGALSVELTRGLGSDPAAATAWFQSLAAKGLIRGLAVRA